MAYYLTPAERRARAQSLVQNRKDVVAYNRYLQQKKDYENQIAQAKLDEENRQKQIESQDFFTRAISTVGDISANIITGALKGLEGIYDLGAGIVGAVGGIFSDKFQDSVKAHIATDWVGTYIGDPLQELTKYSYTKNGGIIEGVASGIGQMLPAVAVTIATAGAGAPAAVGELASLITLGASAAGNSTEEAFNDGASYYAGLGYGLASGAVEMATEKMFAGMGGMFGTGYLDNVTRSIAKQGVARIAKEAVEEGVEEIVSELANPLLKSIYKGSEAFQEYGDPEYWKGVGKAGLIGGLTSMAYGQTVGRVLHTTGKYADVNEALVEVDSLAKKAQNLTETGRLYETTKNGKTNSENIHSSMVENLRLIENTVKKVDESKRGKFIKQAGLTDIVNADGSIKPEYAMSRGLSSMIAQQSTKGQETAQSPLASQPKQYRTAFVDERVIKEALDRGGATAFVGEMTTEQARDFGDFTKVFGKLANKSNGFLKFVVGENVTGNSYIDPQTGVVVMGVDQFGRGTSGVDLANAVITSDMWQKSAIHEVKHSTEGTKQDSKLNAHLYEDNAVFAEARDSFLRRGYFEERVGQDTQKAGEYLDSLMVKFDEVMRNKPKNVSMEEHIAANLTTEEIQDYRTAQSEIGAIAAENVLGNESFIKKLLRKDTNFAQKVLNRIMDMKEAFASLKSKEARAAYNYLQKAEKLYLKAIEEVGARFQKRRIIGIRRLEEGEAVDANPQIEYNEGEAQPQYSKKDRLIGETFPSYKEGKGTQANELSTRWAHRTDIEIGDQTAISFNDEWYLIEKSDNSEWGYRIIDKLTEQEYLTYEEEWKNGNRKGQSIQEGVSRFASLDRRGDSSLRGESNNDSSRPQQRGKNQEIRGVGEKQSQRGQTQSDRSGDSKSRRSSKQGIKYSLKIGDESISGTIEETKNLVALHNLSAENLMKVLELGGFPMPSIAVTKPTLAHDNFGEITVIFGRETIDPQSSSRNKVFSRDAWTPVVPRAEYKPNEAVVEKISKKYYSLARKFSYEAVRPLYKYVHEAEEALLNNEGEANIIKSVYDNTDIMQVFLLDTQGENVSPIQKETVTRMAEGDIIRSKALSEALGDSLKQLEPPLFGSKMQQYLDAHRSEVVEALARAYAEDWGESGSTVKIEEGRKYISEKKNDTDLKKHLVIARRYLLNGIETKTTEYDSQATKSEILKRVNQNEYRAWVDSLFKGIEEKRGVRNDLDALNKRGDRRSFEALHEDYTLENIVAIMRESEKVGHIWGGISPNALAAKLSKEFMSVAEMKASVDSLVGMSEEAKTNFNKIAGNMIDEIASLMTGNKNYADAFSRETSLDGARELLGVLADKKLSTVQEISAYMRREYSGIYTYNESIGRKIIALFEYVKQMTDTDYFEAKPRRAVGFDEIKSVLLPRYINEELVAALKEKGIKYTFYDSWENGARAEIIQNMEGVKFSRKDSQGRSLTQEQQEYFENSQVRDEQGNLLVVYHGSPSANITEFRLDYGGAYFTERADYAEVYKRRAENGRIYECYLNIEKPFDTRNSAERKIFEEEFFRKWGNGANLSEKGLPDWTDGDDLIDFIKEKGYDYDGLILDEGGTPSPNGEVNSRGISYVVFDEKNQVKLVSNSTPTKSSDIRFSLKENQMSALEARGVKGDALLNAIDLADQILAVNGEITADAKVVLYHATTQANANKILETGKMYGKEDNLFFSTKQDGQIKGYGEAIVEAQIPIELLELNDIFDDEIHLTMAVEPYKMTDIRFSRKATDDTAKPTYYHLSDGQIKKMLANNTRFKVYSKADAERIINNVLQNYMSFGEKYGELSGRTRAEVIDMLWKGLNSAKPGYQMGVALHIADYIIQNSVLENLYGDMENIEVQQALDIIGALKPYLHRINLDSIKGEIKYKYDKDNSAYLLWGKRKGESGLGADQIAQKLQGRGIFIEAINEAEIFFEIDAQYRNAIKSLKKKAKEMLAEVLPKEQQKALRQDIAKEVLRGFDYTGKSSQLAGVLDKYRKQISTLYDKLRDSNRHNRATNRLLDKVQKIKNWKTGAFVNSSKFRPKLFKGSIERLAMIKNRGNLNQSGTRRILAGLAEWYAKDNPILGYVDGENVGHYNEEIASILQAVAQNQKPLTDEQVDLIAFLQEKSGISDYKGLLEWYTKDNLKKGYSAEVKSLLRELASETTFTTEELIALDKVVGYFGHLIENHNKVIRNGKYVDAKPIVERYIDTLQRNKGVKVGWFGKFFDKVFNNGKASYLQTFADPMTVARYMDKYESGFFSEMLGELRDGAIRADVLEMNIRLPLEEFLSKHKKYGKGVSKRTITYHGVEIPALDAFLLYMTLNREQALAGLAEAGFAFNDGKETIRVNGFAKGEELTLDELRDRAKAEQDELYKQFTEEDREYISIAETILRDDCRELKRQTDILRMGYSNVVEGYYIPIHRANSAVTVDTSTFLDEGNRVSNAPFNKDTVKGAKGELYISGLDEVLDRHIHGMSQYASLATVIDQYDILYNLNMVEDANKPRTIRTESENTWAKGNDYFKKLISDVQGISPTRGGGSKLFGFLRGGYAKYQLGLNPKVWLTQLSSIFASSSILDYSSIVKGFGIKAPDVDDYCSLAAVRNNDNSAAMAQSVLDKVDKFGSALMKPIGMVDRFVVKRLFGACQAQVQKENGLKIGTKENKVKAGELLQRVILETQQNSMATERSAAMRSGSELMKTLTMFTADSMKVFGRVMDSIGEVSVLKQKIKEASDPNVKESLQAQLKTANKKARKSITALAATAIFMALVAQAFRWLYNKDDDDDESVLATMTVDAIGNLMGGLPLIKDIYAKLTDGYDLNNYAYSAINDLFDAFASIVNFSEGKPAKKVKDIVYAVGQIFGIPTRNVYNIFYGLTKRFSPTTAYEIDNVFYNKNYSSDLQKAIDNDDEDMIATITGLMLDEKVGEIESTTLKRELNSLVSKGYKVLPRSIGNTITYNGEEIPLTSRQKEQFKKVYSEANSELASLVEGKAYRSATEEVKAKAVSFIWDIYYNLAIEDLLGVDLETKNTLFAKAVDISSLAIIVATARGFEADTDKKGKVISGSRKAKVQGYINSLGLKAAQKYMIMGYLGYSNKNGESQVRSYIQRLRLSKSEKEKLFEYSGYAA